ncbi:MAG: hypothetical protein ACK2UT_19875, partial [Candidatus Promineifilaceae bacterium]
MKKHALIVLLISAVLLLAACGEDAEQVPLLATAAGGETTVSELPLLVGTAAVVETVATRPPATGTAVPLSGSAVTSPSASPSASSTTTPRPT